MRLSIQRTALAVSLLSLSLTSLASLNSHRAGAANNTLNQVSDERRQAEVAIEQLKRGQRRVRFGCYFGTAQILPYAPTS